MSARTPEPTARAAGRRAGSTGVPATVLVASIRFGPRLDAERVAQALDRGLRAGGLPAADLCPLQDGVAGVESAEKPDLGAGLAACDFDARLRRARALILCAVALSERTLAGSVAFELATRARQAGVPAYAVARESSLSAFDARILDLGAIVLAGDSRRLVAAGRRLAGLL